MNALATTPLLHTKTVRHSGTTEIGNRHENIKGINKNSLPAGLEPRTYNSKMINLLDKRAQNWLEDTQVDHIIPSVLGGKVPALRNLLSKVENLQLLHKQCHKIKTSFERKNFISLYRQTRVSINNTPIKSMDPQALELVTIKTLIKLYENHRLNDVLKLETKDAHRLKRMYQVAKKKLDSSVDN